MKQGLIILATVVVCLFLAQNLAADTIKGRVVDAETFEPLQGAKVVFKEEAISNGGTEIHTVYADSLGRFLYTCRMEISKLTITASHFGYHSHSVKLNGNNDRDTISIDDFCLKMDEHLLDEVTVKGSVRRFYMRGDTVVFNPSAFRTQDGARLLELIEQLPGVSIKDGKLLWNGEPLKLMINSRDVLSEAMMTNLLSVESVKDIKAYDKKSELAERTGVEDGKEEHVLDVAIKPSFMDKFYGDTELKALTCSNYAAHLRAMQMSDTDPLMFYVRAADDPKVIGIATIQRNGSWQGDTPVRQQTGAFGYGHFWKQDFKVRRQSNWNISIGANHTDIAHSSWENRQTFIPDKAATATNQTAKDYHHELKIPVDFNSFINLSQNSMLSVTANVTYHYERKTEDNKGQTYNLDTPEQLINTSDYHALHDNEGMSSSLQAALFSYAGKTEYAAFANLSYNNMRSNGYSTGIYQFLQNATSQTDHQTIHAPMHNLKAELGLGAKRPVGKQLMLSAEWKTAYINSYDNEQRRRADTLDLGNSLMRKDNTWQNMFHMYANITYGKFSLNPHFEITHWQEQTNYRRGSVLDTLATRSLLLCKPSLKLTYKLAKQTQLRGNIVYDNQRPDLVDCIGYHDDTNPLYIMEGNPRLQTSHTLNTSLAFSTMLSHANQIVDISVGFTKNYSPIGAVFNLNSATGAYRVQKRNMRGGQRWGAKLTYERNLCENFHMKNHIAESFGQAYGIMTIVDDAAGMNYNRQRSSDFSYNLNLEYSDGALMLRLNSDFSWHRYTYSESAQPRQDIYNYQANVTSEYKLKSWTFSLLPTFRLDRGYVADAMNKNRILLNARVHYSFIKNKATVIFYINDIFNQDTRYHSTVTTTTRTEGSSDFLHQYASLTFNYKFESKKK